MNEFRDLDKHLTDALNTLEQMKVPFFGYGDQDKLDHQIFLMKQELIFFEVYYKSVKNDYEEMKVGYEDYREKLKELDEELRVIEEKTFERTHQGLLDYIDDMTQEELIRTRKLIKDKINSAYVEVDDGNLHSSPRTKSSSMSNHHSPNTTSSVYTDSSSCSSSSSYDGGSCGGGF